MTEIWAQAALWLGLARVATLVSIHLRIAKPLPGCAAAARFLLLTLLGMGALAAWADIIGVYPVARAFNAPKRDAAYTTLLMSTGLTFGTISSLFGLSHHVIAETPGDAGWTIGNRKGANAC
ncbi:MAG: hypothetical protein WA190_15020 [Usitatibacter sp.]